MFATFIWSFEIRRDKDCLSHTTKDFLCETFMEFSYKEEPFSSRPIEIRL